MNLFTKLLLILSFIMFGATNLYSQSKSKTPYEQKQSVLLKQFLIGIGFDYATAQKASIDPHYANSIESQIRQKMQQNGLRAIGLSNQLQSDLEKAKSLMNAEEKERDRLQTLKLTQAEDDKKSQEEYLRSDASHLKTIIHNKYIKWSAKSEFEKTEDYQKRLLDKTKVVKDIIINSFREYVGDMNSKEYLRMDCYLGNYNPDRELLELSFENKKGVKWQGSIKLNAEKAKQIKSRARSGQNLDGETIYYSMSIKVVQDKCNLIFYNNNLLSTKIGVTLKLTGEKFTTYTEFHEVEMSSAPSLSDLGAHFFTLENLKIDMNGNENFTLKDINLACNENQNK